MLGFIAPFGVYLRCKLALIRALTALRLSRFFPVVVDRSRVLGHPTPPVIFEVTGVHQERRRRNLRANAAEMHSEEEFGRLPDALVNQN